jgi:O-antigen ligase
VLNGNHQGNLSRTVLASTAIIAIGLMAGFMANDSPVLLAIVMAGGIVLFGLLTRFEYTVLGLINLRSALDSFSEAQLPGYFALAIDALTIGLIITQLLARQPVHTGRFFWFLATWIGLQGLWLPLMHLGGLGLDQSYLSDSIREWIRLFSWLMVYLLVMQLKGRIPPSKAVSILFLGLLLPITVAVLQTIAPDILPVEFSSDGAADSVSIDVSSRIRGSLGHPNTFATFLLLYIGLTLWKFQQSSRQLIWLMLLTTLAFFLVSTKALFILMMLFTFMLVLLIPQFSLVKTIGGLLFFAAVIALFASTEFGRERLGSISETPLLNPNINMSRAIILSYGDGNSFNWRLAEWSFLFRKWQFAPVIGYGLGVTPFVSRSGLLPHNDYVRAVIEGGIVGLILFIFFFVGQFIYINQQLKKSPKSSSKYRFGLSMRAVLVALPVGMLTENIWSHTTFFFYWMACLAILEWDWNPSLDDDIKSKPT